MLLLVLFYGSSVYPHLLPARLLLPQSHAFKRHGPECVCQHPLVLYMEDAKIRRVWPISGPASGLCHGSSPHESSHLRSGHCGASSRGQGDSGTSPERACRHSLTPQAPLGESGADRGGFLSLELLPIREQQDAFPIAGL